MPTFHRGYRYRLSPTPEQQSLFEQFAGTCRFIYNLALEHREREWTGYRDCGMTLNFFQQVNELTQLRAEVDWIRDTPRECEEGALRDLDNAYANFFAGRARYPNFRRRGVGDSFRFRGRQVSIRQLNRRWSEVRLPKVGWVRFRDTRALRGEIKTVTIILDTLGWHATFATAFEAELATQALPDVGIDRGVANTLALSTGRFFRMPDLSELEMRVRSAQRAVARRVRGSNRHALAKVRVAKLRARMARKRTDWRHKTSTELAETFGRVVIEDLNVANMTASGGNKHGLNRSILAQGWTAFARCLDYKLAERGGDLVTVNPAYTSQTCSCCGTIDKQSRESQARFVCRHCGFEAHADTNAAINILRGSAPPMRVEDGGSPAMEARTGNGRKLVENHSAIAG